MPTHPIWRTATSNGTYVHTVRRVIHDADLDVAVTIVDVEEAHEFVAAMTSRMTGIYVGDGGLLNSAGMYLLGDNLPHAYFKEASDSPWQFTVMFSNYGLLQAIFAVGGPDQKDPVEVLCHAEGISVGVLAALGRGAAALSLDMDCASTQITKAQA